MNRRKRITRGALAAASALALTAVVFAATSTENTSVAAPGDKTANEQGWPMNSRGEPRTEKFDPASQPQTSLKDAAQEPNGIGVTELAAGMKKSKTRRDIKPEEVLANYAAKNGGCIGDYGKPGQCLPVVPPSHVGHEMTNHLWECSEVRKHFKDGIELRVPGNDPQKLDSNGDNIACGKGDAR
jgi:hypothetical protein